MKNFKLTIELVPKGAWGNNLRKCLSQKDWDTLRSIAYKRSGYKCSICGNEENELHAHEVWEFDISSKTQTLKDIIALCPACHGVKHMRNSQRIGYGETSKRHFMKINNCDELKFANYLFEAEILFNERNKIYRWKLKTDVLEKLGGKEMNVEQKKIPMIVSPYKNIDWNNVKFNEMKSLFKLSESKDNLGPPSVCSINVNNYQGTITVISKYTNKIDWITGSSSPETKSQIIKTSYNINEKFTTNFSVKNMDPCFLCFELSGDGGKTLSQLFEIIPEK